MDGGEGRPWINVQLGERQRADNERKSPIDSSLCESLPQEVAAVISLIVWRKWEAWSGC